MSKLGESFPLNENKLKSESGGETMSSLGKSFPVNVDKLKSEIEGGGDSDLSTATITVTCVGRDFVDADGAFIINNAESSYGGFEFDNEGVTSVSTILYKGKSGITFDIPAETTVEVTSGDASWEENAYLVVEGDCAITITFPNING